MQHPIHPALVHFPVAFWSFATLTDIAGLFVNTGLWPFAGMMLAIGCTTALAAMAAGMWDLSQVQHDADVAKKGINHATAAITTFSFYLTTFIRRLDDGAIGNPDAVDIGISIAGLIALGITGWLGGHLVYRYGVGVNRPGYTGDSFS